MSNRSLKTPGLQTPQQARSQKTLQKILEATIELLDEKTFTDLSVNEIVERAGCSVGSFYARFKDKDTLLHALDEAYVQEALSLIAEAADQETVKQASLPEILQASMETMYELHTRHRGLMRTLILAARTQEDERFRERERRLAQALPQFFSSILAHRDCIHHPNPELAVQFGYFQSLYALREIALWDHLADTVPIWGKALISELVRGYLAYLDYKE